MKGNIIMFYGCMEVCSQARTFMLGMFANCQKRERKCEIAKKKLQLVFARDLVSYLR